MCGCGVWLGVEALGAFCCVVEDSKDGPGISILSVYCLLRAIWSVLLFVPKPRAIPPP